VTFHWYPLLFDFLKFKKLHIFALALENVLVNFAFAFFFVLELKALRNMEWDGLTDSKTKPEMRFTGTVA